MPPLRSLLTLVALAWVLSVWVSPAVGSTPFVGDGLPTTRFSLDVVVVGGVGCCKNLPTASDFDGNMKKTRVKSGSCRWCSLRNSVGLRFSSCLISAALFSFPTRLASFCLAASKVHVWESWRRCSTVLSIVMLSLSLAAALRSDSLATAIVGSLWQPLSQW